MKAVTITPDMSTIVDVDGNEYVSSSNSGYNTIEDNHYVFNNDKLNYLKCALKHNITFEMYPNDSLSDGITKSTGTQYDIIYNGNVIGSIYTDDESGKYVSISSLGSAVNIQQEYRGKHFGTYAYIKLALETESRGKTLRSAILSAMSSDAKRLWESLVNKGFARIENDRYYFNEIDISKVVDENGEPLVVYHGTLVGSYVVLSDLTIGYVMSISTDRTKALVKQGNKYLRLTF